MKNESEVSREQLEAMAQQTCSADIYYELMDQLDMLSDMELWEIVKGAAGYNHDEE